VNTNLRKQLDAILAIPMSSSKIHKLYMRKSQEGMKLVVLETGANIQQRSAIITIALGAVATFGEGIGSISRNR
jgi:hypothetical protein